MNKKILTLTAGLMMAASVGFAAPVTDLQQGETVIGYNHYGMNHSTDSDSFYLENGLSDRFVIGIERSGYAFPFANMETTDGYVGYKLDPHVRVFVGDRNYSGDTNYNESSNKFIYGVGGVFPVAPKLDGYVTVTGSSISTEVQAGVAYKLDGQTSLQLGYKNYNEDDGGPNVNGFGFGINHKF